MRVDLHPAFVLHQRAYRESSALLEVLSSAHGRVGLVARGARARGPAWRANLQPLRPLLVAWSGRGELGTLTGLEADGPALVPAGRHLLSGLYMNELLVRLLPRHDPCARLYACYERSLHALAAAQAAAPVLRLFEKELLETLGYGLLLERDVHSGAPIAAQERYHYHAELGPSRSANAAAASVTVTGRTLLGLARGRLEDAETLREARTLMRFLLQPHLGPRPLHTRELLSPVKGVRS